MNTLKFSIVLLLTFQLLACTDRWHLKIADGRYSEVARYTVENLSYGDANEVMLSDFKKSLGISDNEILLNFEGQSPRYDIKLSYINSEPAVGSYQRVVAEQYGLSLDVIGYRSTHKRILERKFNDINWKYPLDKTWKYPFDHESDEARKIVYLDENMLIIKEEIKYRAVFTIIDMKTGAHRDSSPPVSIMSTEGYRAGSKAIYIALGSTSRDQDSHLVKYDIESKSIVPIAAIPNDFSNGKMAIRMQPMLSFLNDKYVLVEISTGGRGINFCGFVVVDVNTGEFVLHDVKIGRSGSFTYYATEGGDFVYSKRLTDDSIIRHVKFN